MLRGACQYAQTKPDWVLTPAPPDRRAIAQLRQLDCRGLIVHVQDRQLADMLRNCREPLVNIATVVPDLPFRRVTMDLAESGRVAARHLLDCGFRQFGFLGHAWHEYSVLREAGFCEVIRAAGHSVTCHHERSGMNYPPRGRLWRLGSRVQKWLASLPKPIGIFVPSDEWSMELSEACREMRLRVPDQLAILGTDNDDLLCNMARPTLSSVAFPAERVGYEAAKLLDRLLHNEEDAPHEVLLPPGGVAARQSTDVLAIDDADVAAAVRFIRQRADTPLRVDDVVEHVAVARRSLDRKFQQSLQRGVGEEIRRAHVDRARMLLTGTEMSVAAVAERSGFSDLRQLSTVFHQWTGMTPTAYRRHVRGETGLRSDGSL
jgi:LacI family transcriptional regulator